MKIYNGVSIWKFFFWTRSFCEILDQFSVEKKAENDRKNVDILIDFICRYYLILYIHKYTTLFYIYILHYFRYIHPIKY